MKIKELIHIDENQPDEIINKIKHLVEISQIKNDQYEKLRNLLNIKDDNLIESAMKLTENLYQLQEENQQFITSK